MLTTTQEIGSAVGLATGIAVSIAVIAYGGSAIQVYNFSILVSTGLVLLGLLYAMLVLPSKKQ